MREPHAVRAYEFNWSTPEEQPDKQVMRAFCLAHGFDANKPIFFDDITPWRIRVSQYCDAFDD